MTPRQASRKRPPKPADSREIAMLCAAAALDKKAHDLLLMDVAEPTAYADYFLLASGRSTRQTASIAENIQRVMKKAGISPLGVDGLRQGRWACLDFGDVVVHVFHEPVRENYDLESLWGDAPRIELDLDMLSKLLPPENEA